MSASAITPNAVTRETWLEARLQLLKQEKEFSIAREELAALRRELPKVEIGEEYIFQTPDGAKKLNELFGDKSQLIVQHFMFGPDWDEGCPSCSYWADGYDGIDRHLAQRDAAFVTISRAPLEKLQAYQKRMGWSFSWISSLDNNFNADFDVSFTQQQMENGNFTYNYHNKGFPASEAPGISVFSRDNEGRIFHTYSTFARGLDMMNCAYQYLDLLPKGRDEQELTHPMAWVKRHDSY